MAIAQNVPTTLRDALAKFESDKFDLLVTDYRMEGMNGLELARLIRQKAPDFPIIIVTGYPPVEGSDRGQCVA